MNTPGSTPPSPAEDHVITAVEEESNGHHDRIHGALRRIIRSVEIDSKQLSSRFSITGPQLVTLRSIVENGPLCSTELSKTVHLSPSTIVGILDRLQARKLIKRRRDSSDRRRVMVSASIEGNRLAQILPDSPILGLNAAIDKLQQPERDSLALALEKIAMQLDGAA